MMTPCPHCGSFVDVRDCEPDERFACANCNLDLTVPKKNLAELPKSPAGYWPRPRAFWLAVTFSIGGLITTTAVIFVPFLVCFALNAPSWTITLCQQIAIFGAIGVLGTTLPTAFAIWTIDTKRQYMKDRGVSGY